MKEGCLEDAEVLARLVWFSTNRASGNKLKHCKPRKDDLRPRHLLQTFCWESWGKHGHDGR